MISQVGGGGVYHCNTVDLLYQSSLVVSVSTVCCKCGKRCFQLNLSVGIVVGKGRKDVIM